MLNNMMMQSLQMLKANPIQFLMQRRFNFPQGIQTTDPQAILNHLVQSGQVSQQQIDNAYRMAQQFR